jgi:hypothetical protein
MDLYSLIYRYWIQNFEYVIYLHYCHIYLFIVFIFSFGCFFFKVIVIYGEEEKTIIFEKRNL